MLIMNLNNRLRHNHLNNKAWAREQGFSLPTVNIIPGYFHREQKEFPAFRYIVYTYQLEMSVTALDIKFTSKYFEFTYSFP